MQPILANLAQAYGLGELLKAPLPVTGGRTHLMWKIETTLGNFAVKNLTIPATDSDRLANIRHTEQLAYYLNQQQFPALVAIQRQGDPIFTMANKHYIVYPWLAATMLGTRAATLQQVRAIGRLLKQLHQLDPQGIKLTHAHYPSLTRQEWQALAQTAQYYQLSYAEQFIVHLPLLMEIDEQSALAIANLTPEKVISHGDLDPYNVLWFDEYSLHVIDWELANLTHPAIDFVATLLYWSLDSNRINRVAMQEFMQGYQVNQQFQGMITKAFYVVLGHWLKWFQFNLLRATTSKEDTLRMLSDYEAQKTLQAVIYLAPLIAQLSQVIEHTVPNTF